MNDLSQSALFPGVVAHSRIRPIRHALRYRLVSMLIDIDELEALDRQMRLFSVDRWNLFSFRLTDHGDGSNRPLRQQLDTAMAAAGIVTGGPIRLLSMPRILGWSFNPLSVFFCHRPDESLAAIVWEVDNTFGDRHSYLIPAVVDADGCVRQRCAKSLYVSPFIEMAMTYDFIVRPPTGDTFTITISVSDDQGTVMTAQHFGRRVELTDRALLRAFLSWPLQAFAVLGGIHWQALKLWLKGARMQRRSPPPQEPISLGTSRHNTTTRARSP